MKDFELPSNIKQIGTIGDGLKIYVEDYVNTYLKQYAEAGGHCEKQAFLIGKYMVIDGQSYLFISGAIQGKYGDFEDGIESFSEKSFAYANEQIGLYFKGLDIVGWMQSQPGYGTTLNQVYGDFHMSNFTKPWHTLFVMDPVERVNTFYTWNDDMSGLRESKGYFIYYDKNQGMHEYMLENKVIRLTMRERALVASAVAVAKKSAPEMAKEPVVYDKSTLVKKKDHPEYKRVINMLVSLSAVLFVICLIMGVGLIQNDGRIAKLEQDFNALDTAYSYLASTASRNNTQTVFAQDNNAENSSEENVGEQILEVADSPETGNLEGQAIETANEPDEPAQNNQENIVEDITAGISSVENNGSTENNENAESNTENNINNIESNTQNEPEGQQETVENNITVDNTTLQQPQTIQNETIDTGQAVANAPLNRETSLPESYIVQEGDSLNFISTRFYGSSDMVDAIMELNGIDDPDKIFFGKVLLLPPK